MDNWSSGHWLVCLGATLGHLAAVLERSQSSMRDGSRMPIITARLLRLEAREAEAQGGAIFFLCLSPVPDSTFLAFNSVLWDASFRASLVAQGRAGGGLTKRPLAEKQKTCYATGGR